MSMLIHRQHWNAAAEAYVELTTSTSPSRPEHQHSAIANSSSYLTNEALRPRMVTDPLSSHHTAQFTHPEVRSFNHY